MQCNLGRLDPRSGQTLLQTDERLGMEDTHHCTAVGDGQAVLVPLPHEPPNSHLSRVGGSVILASKQDQLASAQRQEQAPRVRRRRAVKLDTAHYAQAAGWVVKV